jgi:uncharacterized membrane protein YkvA (DUF1232 family)
MRCFVSTSSIRPDEALRRLRLGNCWAGCGEDLGNLAVMPFGGVEMRCLRCQQEIALARKCPYCGYKMTKEQQNASWVDVDQDESKGKGTFRGRMTRREHTEKSLFGLLPTLFRYFSDPGVRSWRKNLIILGLLYVISPLDLLPGAAFPLVGWMDDAMVFAIVWRILIGELERYRRTEPLE